MVREALFFAGRRLVALEAEWQASQAEGTWYAKMKATAAQVRDVYERLEVERREAGGRATQHPAVTVLYDASVNDLELALAAARLAAKAAARHDAKRTAETRAIAIEKMSSVRAHVDRAFMLYVVLERDVVASKGREARRARTRRRHTRNSRPAATP
jgi:hypothetical protein